MKILIIDPIVKNPPILYQQLRSSNYSLLDIETDVAKAISSIVQNKPNLLIIETDNNLQHVAAIMNYVKANNPDLQSIIILNELQKSAIQKMQNDNAAYLTRPYTLKNLFSIIESAMRKSISVTEAPDELFLKTGTRYERLNLQQLLYAKANGKYTELHFSFGKRLMRISLTNFIKEKININLLRVHKSYAVNTTAISSYKSDEVEVGSTHIPIGRFFKEGVQHFLKRNTLLLSINQKF